MSDIKTQLETLRELLEKDEADGTLTEKRAQVLKLLRSDRLSPEISLMLQGATANMSDEIGAYFGSGKFQPVADLYNQTLGAEVSPYDVNLALTRMPMDQYREENPLKAMGYEAAGAAATALTPLGLMGNVGRAASVAANANRGKVAAGSGALAGYGSGETTEERLGNAAVGTVLGGATQKAVDLVGDSLARPIMQSLQGPRRVKKMGRDAARSMLSDAIEADAKTVEEAIAYIGQQQGKQITLADIGENTRTLIDVLATLPGPGKTQAASYLSARREGRPARLTTLLQETFGSQSRFFDDFAALKAARGKNANVLYGQANKINVPITDEFAELMRFRPMQDAYMRAVRIAETQDPDAKVMRQFSIGTDGQLRSAEGEVVSDVSTRFLHFMKLGLDDLAFPRFGQDSAIGSTELAGIRDIRNKFIATLDEANPQYKRARDLYAGDTRMMESLQLGRSFLRGDPDEIAADLANASKSEFEAFRLGAMHALQESMEATPETANMAQNMMRSPKRKRLIRMTFTGEKAKADADFEKFMSNLRIESGMARVEQAGANSATAQRQELMRDLTGAVEAGGLPISPTQLLDNQLRILGEENTRLGKRAAGDELARMMTTDNPAELSRIQRQLTSGIDPREVFVNAVTSPISTPLSAIGNLATNPFVVGQAAGTLPTDLGVNLGSLVDPFLNPEQQQLQQ